MSAVLSPPPGSLPCVACGRLPRWAGEANDAEGFCPGCLDADGSETGLSPAELFEAGRLAAIRADVDLAAWQLERWAAEALDRARGLQNVLDSADFLFGVDRAEMQAESDEARIKAKLLTAKAADCRRWLEATR